MRRLLLCVILIAPIATADPVRVELRIADGKSQLYRDGKPYFIQGGGGTTQLKELTAAGGNSIRTWGADHLDKTLDEAQSLGLTVTVGIWLGHKDHGFDYKNARQVKAQYEMAQRAILKYKDHPALLMWGLGNEMETAGNENSEAMWAHINSLAELVHKLDPNHPAMTVVAEIGGAKVSHIHKLCPQIDVVGINAYGGAASVLTRYAAAGGTKPYVLTEFGPPGIWESKKNSFGVAEELTSTAKARWYEKAWVEGVHPGNGLSLGGYAFVWGHKQETTATWFGMFLADGARLAPVDALTEVWTGKPPANRCPVIRSLKVDGSNEAAPDAAIHVVLDATDPENDPLTVKWVLQAEGKSFGVGGAAEATPPTFPDAITHADAKAADVTLPKAGTYRLFAYIYDDHGGAAVGNVALYAKGAVAKSK